MNSCSFIGRPTRDPEIVDLENTRKATFTLAVRRSYRRNDDDPEADFPRFVAFGPVVDIIEKYVVKGKFVGVDAEYRTNRWEDDEGEVHYSNDFFVKNIHLIEFPDRERDEDDDDEWPRRKVKPSAKGSAKASKVKSKKSGSRVRRPRPSDDFEDDGFEDAEGF